MKNTTNAHAGSLPRMVRLRPGELRWLILMWRDKAYDCRLMAKCNPALKAECLKTARMAEQRAAQLTKQANYKRSEPAPLTNEKH